MASVYEDVIKNPICRNPFQGFVDQADKGSAVTCFVKIAQEILMYRGVGSTEVHRTCEELDCPGEQVELAGKSRTAQVDAVLAAFCQKANGERRRSGEVSYEGFFDTFVDLAKTAQWKGPKAARH